jgi:hypothetical protein
MGSLASRIVEGYTHETASLSSRRFDGGTKETAIWPSEVSRVAPKNRVPVLENIRGWHSRNFVPVLQKSIVAVKKQRLVLEKCRWWHPKIASRSSRTVAGGTQETAFLSSRRVDRHQKQRPFPREMLKVAIKKRRLSALQESRVAPKKKRSCHQKGRGGTQNSEILSSRNIYGCTQETGFLSSRRVEGGTMETENLSS